MSPQKISSKEILAIKILAEYTELNKYIYIVLFIDKYHSKLIDIAFVISDDHKLLRFLESYNNFLEMYKHIKIYNKLNSYRKTILFEKFQKVLDDIFSDEKNINNMIIFQSNNNTISIIDIFASSLNRFMDFHIGTFDLVSTLFDFDEVYAGLESIHKELENASSPPQLGYNDSSNTVDQKTESLKEPEVPNYKLINASFIVDPISGTSINDIRPGDKVMVSINSNTVEENIIYLELKGKKDKYSKYLVPAEVLEKTVGDKSIKILLKLIDGYCCLIEEIEPIKLKIFNPIKDVYIEGEENDPEKDKDTIFDKIFSRFSTFRLVMFGLGAVILLVFFAIVYVFFFQT